MFSVAFHQTISDKKVNELWSNVRLYVIFPWSKEGKYNSIKPVLTYGAVRTRPVGLADADSRLRVEGAVTGALLRTSALQDVAADPSPAGVTVALAVVTGSVAGAHRVQTVHWRHRRDVTSGQAIQPPHLCPATSGTFQEGPLSMSVRHR